MTAAAMRVVRAAVAYRTARVAAQYGRAPEHPDYWRELCAALDALAVANAEAAPVLPARVAWDVPPGEGVP